jgi:hypothetical protein
MLKDEGELTQRNLNCKENWSNWRSMM